MPTNDKPDQPKPRPSPPPPPASVSPEQLARQQRLEQAVRVEIAFLSSKAIDDVTSEDVDGWIDDVLRAAKGS